MSPTRDRFQASEEARDQRRTSHALLAVARALSGRAPIENIMRRIGRALCRAVDADAVAVYVLDARQDVLLPVAAYRIPSQLVEMFRRMPLPLERWPGVRDSVRSRQVMWVRDVTIDPRCDRSLLASVAPHSALFVPAVARGQSIGGVCLLTWRTEREFSRAEIRLAEAVAAQVGLALDNVDLVRQTEVTHKETETVLSVSRALSSTLDVGALLRHFLRRIASVMDADGVGTYLLDRDGEWLIPLQGYRLPPERLEALRALRLSIVHHPFYAEGARTRRAVFSSDAMHDERIPAVMRQAAPHTSELFVPIVAKGRLVGGLIAGWWTRTRDASENDLALVEAIATQAAVVLENVRLFQEDRRQRKELSIVHALSRAVTGELDRRMLIEALYAQVALVFDARDLLIVIRGKVEREVLVALCVRDGVRDPASFERRPADDVGLSAVVMNTGVPIRTADYAHECVRHGIDPSARSAWLQHWLGVPMTVGDTVLGVVALGNSERAFNDADERLLTNISQLAAVALASARLFEERESAYSELYLLSRITDRALRRWRDSAREAER